MSKNEIPKFNQFFHNGTVLIPIPSSNPDLPPEDWPSTLIAEQMVTQRLAMGIEAVLRRSTKIRKSAVSAPKERPNPEDHAKTLNCLEAQSNLPLQITLIDDVFTRGATLLGAAKVMKQAFPNAMIQAFTLFWTCRRYERLKTMNMPVTGTLKIGTKGQPVRRKRKIQK